MAERTHRAQYSHHILRSAARLHTAVCRSAAWGSESLRKHAVKKHTCFYPTLNGKQWHSEQRDKRILLPMSVTSRDTGRGLSKTNLESRHSCRMKLLFRNTQTSTRTVKINTQEQSRSTHKAGQSVAPCDICNAENTRQNNCI